MNSKVSNLEDHIGYHLRCLSNFVSYSFEAKLAARDVSVAQWVVMRVLFDCRDMTLNEAAKSVGVDKSSLSRMVERLMQKGLVSRDNGVDRRSVSLSLTPAGKKLVPQLARLADENDQEFFGLLSKKKKDELLNVIQRLLKGNGWDESTRGKDRME